MFDKIKIVNDLWLFSLIFSGISWTLSYSNPPQRRNTSNQLEKVLSHKPSSGSNAAQTPPRPHSTMVDHDKFARMRLGSLPDVSTGIMLYLKILRPKTDWSWTKTVIFFSFWIHLNCFLPFSDKNKLLQTLKLRKTGERSKKVFRESAEVDD